MPRLDSDTSFAAERVKSVERKDEMAGLALPFVLHASMFTIQGGDSGM